jgi:hypothetical protein
MYCQFEMRKGWLHCIHGCGQPPIRELVHINAARWPKRRCAKPSPPIDIEPAAERLGVTLDHAKHYAAALARWTAKGFPVRTQEQVVACLAVCQGGRDTAKCGEFTGGRCKQCGCRVSASSIALVNKAKMATEDCKLRKWPKLETPSVALEGQ